MSRLAPELSGLLLTTLAACGTPSEPAHPSETGAAERDARSEERRRLVDSRIANEGVQDERVLAALRRVPRHLFVPDDVLDDAYEDRPLPIGHGQTISQPYVVATMTQAARVTERSRVLEIGTGSGYQAAVLAELAAEVWTIEIVPALAKRSAVLLASLGYENVHTREGDGYRGWPEHAPFDAIVVTAAPDHVPPALKEQLAVGGRLVLPVGSSDQELKVIERREDGYAEWSLYPVRFVPMTGDARGD